MTIRQYIGPFTIYGGSKALGSHWNRTPLPGSRIWVRFYRSVGAGGHNRDQRYWDGVMYPCFRKLTNYGETWPLINTSDKREWKFYHWVGKAPGSILHYSWQDATKFLGVFVRQETSGLQVRMWEERT